MPLSDAVIVTVPGVTAVTWMVPLEPPAGIVTVVGTAATAELLLDSATMTPPTGAAELRVIVPWTWLPATTLVPFKLTLDTETVGLVGEFEPQAARPTSNRRSRQSVFKRPGLWLATMCAPRCHNLGSSQEILGFATRRTSGKSLAWRRRRP